MNDCGIHRKPHCASLYCYLLPFGQLLYLIRLTIKSEIELSHLEVGITRLHYGGRCSSSTSKKISFAPILVLSRENKAVNTTLEIQRSFSAHLASCGFRKIGESKGGALLMVIRVEN